MEKTPDSLRPDTREMPTPARHPWRQKYAETLVDVGSRLKFAGGPRWAGQRLSFLDYHDRRIKSVDLTGKVETVLALPFLPGSFELPADGALIITDASRRKLYRYESTEPTIFADLSNVVGFCLGDSVIDYRGGLYIGDVGYDFLNPLVDPVPAGIITYISGAGESSVVANGLFTPSGMAITQDNNTLIVGETSSHRLTAFEIKSDGALCNRRVWAQLENDINPNGICLDSEDAVWIAGTGSSALRVQEGGEIETEVKTKQPVYAIALGGPERKHLFICTSATSDPVITRRTPSATIDIAEVGIPGNESP